MTADASVVTFDAREYRLDESVIAVYNFAQSHPDLVHLSAGLLALYNQFQQGNYVMTDTIYMKILWEVHPCNQIIANYANEESMCQEYIDAHS